MTNGQQASAAPGEAATYPRPSNPNAPRFVSPTNQNEVITAEDLFGRQFRGAVVKIQYLVKSHRIQQFYRRDFIHLSQLLYALDNYREINGIDAGRIDAAEEQVEAKLDAVKGLIKRVTMEATALIEQNGHAETPCDFARPVCLEAPIISPFAREYLELLIAADGAYELIEKSWLLGLIDRKSKLKQEFGLRKAIRATSAFVRSKRIELLKHIQSLRQRADEPTATAIDNVTTRETSTLVAQGVEDQEALASVSFEQELRSLSAGSTRTAAEPVL